MLEIRESTDDDPARFEAAMPSADGAVYAWHHAAQQRGEVTHLVALRDGVPVGHAVIDWAGCVDLAVRAALPGAVEVRNLHVGPDARGLGVGSALVAEAERRAVGRGAEALVLRVGVDNDAAARLYVRLGYRDSGLRSTSTYRWPDAFGEEIVEHDIAMVKNLV